jgi:hypothetical protein
VTLELSFLLNILLEEALNRFDAERHPSLRYAPRGDISQYIKAHILDRWYRFASYGITGRGDLDKLKVTCTSPSPYADMGSVAVVFTRDPSSQCTSRTTVSVVGTKLENQ